MNLSERLNVLIQAITLSQKNGGLDLNDAVSAKYAIDVISSGVLNETFASAINTLIEIIISSQKKGIYSLKDSHIIYVAIEGIENELQNEVNRLNGIVSQERTLNEQKVQEQVQQQPVQQIQQRTVQHQQVPQQEHNQENVLNTNNQSSNGNVITIPSKKIKRNT